MKITKKCITALAALSLVFLCSFHAFADTYYYDDGYLYTMPDQNHAIIFGVDGDDYSELDFPEQIHYKWVSAVGIYAFSGDEKVTSVSCENASRMEKISAYAFENCTNLTSAKLTPSIQTIGVGAFEGCTSMNAFDWANAAVEVISTQAFYGCSSLNEMEIPDKVTTIEPFAFANCSSLETVTIGKTVTQIADSAFNNDSALTIACYYGSCANEFAVAHNIPYILLDSVLLGDANGDGYVNISDVTDIQRAVAEIDTLDDLRKKAADVNGDGVVTIDDATILQMYLAEFATAYPIGEVTAQ